MDNTFSDANDVSVESQDAADLIVEALERMKEVDISRTWLKCVNFPAKGRDKYNIFMERNLKNFEPIFARLEAGKYRQMHRLVNYFMMLVYLEVMNEKVAPSNDCSEDSGGMNSELLPWVQLFAAVIMDAEAGPRAHMQEMQIASSANNQVSQIIESA